MRLLALGLAIAVIIFVVSGGHVLFLPLLFVPLGLFSFGLWVPEIRIRVMPSRQWRGTGGLESGAFAHTPLRHCT
jgi:hypothetical protein